MLYFIIQDAGAFGNARPRPGAAPGLRVGTFAPVCAIMSAKEMTDMAKRPEKTNVMRALDSKKIAHLEHSYESEGAISAVEVAGALGIDPARIFKTLVTVGASREHYVFVIPGAEELDLKKAAKAAGEKSIAMIPSKELLPLTGYVHGGCSPIGMKKPFRTFIHETAAALPTIVFSAGKIGYQVELPLAELQKLIRVEPADLVVER